MPTVTRYIIAKLPAEPARIETRDGHQKIRRGDRARFYRGVDGVRWHGWRFEAWQFLTKDDAYDVLVRIEEPGETLSVQPLRYWGAE